MNLRYFRNRFLTVHTKKESYAVSARCIHASFQLNNFSSKDRSTSHFTERIHHFVSFELHLYIRYADVNGAVDVGEVDSQKRINNDELFAPALVPTNPQTCLRRDAASANS